MSAALRRLRYLGARAAESPPRFVVAWLLRRTRVRAMWPLASLERHTGLLGPFASLRSWEPPAALLEALGSALRESAVVSGQVDALMRRLDSDAIPCLGFGTMPLASGTNWHVDELHGYRFPERFFAGVDFLASHARCDVKVVWERNRLQPLLWLALSGARAGDPAPAASRMMAIVDDWATANPVGFGVNWVSAMEVAIRATNVALAASVLWQGLTPPQRHRVRQLLGWHRAYLRHVPEHSDRNGNHYLVNLLGLLVISALGGDRREFDADLERFESEAVEQFEPDGGHVERAPCYHGLCTRVVDLALALATRRVGVAPERLVKVYGEAVAFCEHVASPDARLSLFADNDSGTVLDLGDDARDASIEVRRYREPAAVPGELLRDVVMSALANDRDYWRLDGIAPSGARAQRSGFIRLERGEIRVLQRVGSKGLYGRAPHDHDDSGSLIAWFGDLEVLSERGTAAYTRDASERGEDIASTSHNLTGLAGSLRFPGRAGSVFLTSRGAPVAELVSLSGEQAITRVPLGDNAPGCSVERTVFLPRDARTIVIRDQVQLDRSRALTSRFHFGPSMELQSRSLEGQVRVGSQTIARWNLGSEARVEASVAPYAHFPRYGEGQQAMRIDADWTATDGAMIELSLTNTAREC